LSKIEFRQEINKKLQEEVGEFLADESLEELADIQEVVHGILQSMGKTFDELEKVRLDKKRERGGFENQVFLESILLDD
jgi:predicted house-cleaning noncanonical NTP pyrophosphatase (MazG superfamily)